MSLSINPVMAELVDRVKPRVREGWQKRVKTRDKTFLDVDFNVAQALMLLPTHRVTVTKTPPEIAHRVRAAFTDDSRYEFRNVALIDYLRRTEGFGTDAYIQEQWKNMEIHHIIPLNLGGQNDWNNLAVLHPAIHRALHDVINGAVSGLKMGHSREIDIPGSEPQMHCVWLEHMQHRDMIPPPVRPTDEAALQGRPNRLQINGSQVSAACPISSSNLSMA